MVIKKYMSLSLKFVSYVFFLLLILYVVCLGFNLFNNFEWVDIPMHFLGGFLAGGIFFFLFGYFFENDDVFKNNIERSKIIILSASFAALIGVLWEFFEFFLELSFFTGQIQGIRDTMGDLFWDIIGGIVIGVWVLFLRRRYGYK